MKNQKGITLIALIITIIVLLILAGVSISLVVGQNGVLSKAQNAAGATRLASLKEELELWNANNVINKYAPGDTETLAEVLDRLVSAGTITELEKTIMLNGGKNDGAIVIDGEEFSIKEFLKDKGSEEQMAPYLVDTVEVGDYVNINIDYENKQSFNSNSYIITTSELTGWRVLSKSGSGETGTVKLVSAGCPLTYYHSKGDSSVSIPNLEDLNKELTIVDSGTGFRANGIKLNGNIENDLSKIFTTDKYVDTTKGIHALGCSTHYDINTGSVSNVYTPLDEVEEVYTRITDVSKSMTELNSADYLLGTATLISTAGEKWKSNYTDLLSNGQEYWLSGTSAGPNGLWVVSARGTAFHYTNQEYGVRPVISLQSGVKLDSNNTGDGTSSSTAYKITK